MSDLKDVKNQLNAFRLRPNQHRSPSSSPVSPRFSFPAITPSSSNSSLKSNNSSSSSASSKSSNTSSSSNVEARHSRPLSHHRRKSSVSTRRESNEIMGVVSQPEDEDSSSVDEIRKRALLALEGRSVVQGFAKVEIPDWKTPTAESKAFDWDLPKVASHLGSNSLVGKRDSFGRNLVSGSIANKAELQTLVEEDEEEEESGQKKTASLIPTTHITGPTPLKARPASLALRSLSLVSDLPTPNATPSPRGAGGMRPLTLLPSPSIYSTPTSSHRSSLGSSLSSDSPSSPITPSPPVTSTVASRRQSLFGYKRLSPSTDLREMGNITPSRTPQSSVSSSASHERSLSPTEVFAQQAYTLQNHASLLDRIATLEDALAAAQSRSASADELIALVADLKAERDALHASVAKAEEKQGEFQRASDISKKRLETARQEAWMYKDRAETLQVELDRVISEKTALELEKVAWTKERTLAAREKEVRDLEYEMLEERYERLKRELNESVQKSEILSSRRYMSSMDSRHSSATTVVEELGSVSSVDSFRVSSKIKETDLAAVVEEEEAADNDDLDDPSGGLASYESEPAGYEDYLEATYDEDDDDDDNDSDEEDRDVTPRVPQVERPFDATQTIHSQNLAPGSRPSVFATQPPPQQQQHARAPSHARRTSLVSSWKFPRGPVTRTRKPSKVDRFIPGLLDSDDEGSTDESTPVTTPLPTELLGKSLGRGSSKKTKVEVTPDLADSFAMNFEADEMFTFGAGDNEKEDTIVVAKPAPLTAPVNIFAEPLEHEPMFKKFDVVSASLPTSFPAPARMPSPIPAGQKRAASPVPPSDLIPPPMQYSAKMGGNIVPLVPVKAPPPVAVATVPSTPIKTRVVSQTRSRPLPPPFTPPPRVVVDASKRSSTMSPPSTTATNSISSTLDESFSFFSTPAPSKTKTNSSTTNVVAFPTTSASPFSMRLSLSSFSSLMPWSPRGQQQPSTSSVPEEDDEEEEGANGQTSSMMKPASSGFSFTSTAMASNNKTKPPMGTRRAQVDRDVMRERLRARLVMEGKIPTAGGSSRPGTPPVGH